MGHAISAIIVRGEVDLPAVGGAAAYHAGRALLEPLVARGNAVNQALREIGVSKLGFHDEFEALGLERFRRADDFLAWRTGRR